MARGKTTTADEKPAPGFKPSVSKITVGRDFSRSQAPIDVLHHFRYDLGVRKSLAREQSGLFRVSTLPPATGKVERSGKQALSQPGIDRAKRLVETGEAS